MDGMDYMDDMDYQPNPSHLRQPLSSLFTGEAAPTYSSLFSDKVGFP